MEKVNLINSEDYLERIRRGDVEVPIDELRESLLRLEKPLRDIEYLDKGTETVELGKLKMQFAYSSPDEASMGQVALVVKPTNLASLFEYQAIENWRVLDEINFTIDGSMIDLIDNLPGNCFVLFNPFIKEQHGSVVYSGDSSVIFIVGDVATPRAIVTLLHEIGHLFDNKNLNNIGVSKLTTDHKYSSQAEVLRKERAASAFAFKAMRPYLSTLGIKDDTINFLKHYALESYYQSARNKIIEDRAMDRWARDEYGDDPGYISDSDQRLYDFDDWRKTEAFKKWKEMPENAEIKDYSEEYVKWSEWVDSTNYDYLKDLHRPSLL